MGRAYALVAGERSKEHFFGHVGRNKDKLKGHVVSDLIGSAIRFLRRCEAFGGGGQVLSKWRGLEHYCLS